MNVFQTTRVIKDVVPKTGTKHNPNHSELLGRPCIMLDFSPGEPAWFAAELERDPGKLHRFRTSSVVDFRTEFEEDGREVLVLETRNTTYYIAEAIPDESVECAAQFDLRDFRVAL